MTTSVPRRPRGDNAGRLFDRNRIDFSDLLFDSISLKKLLLPLIVEQLLTSFMGMADTMMISRVGSAAISAVSLVDSINILVIQVFAALATGGTIVCSQYIGHGDKARTNSAARQVVLTILFISCLAAAACMIFCTPILRLVFGTVEEAVMVGTHCKTDTSISMPHTISGVTGVSRKITPTTTTTTSSTTVTSARTTKSPLDSVTRFWKTTSAISAVRVSARHSATATSVRHYIT